MAGVIRAVIIFIVARPAIDRQFRVIAIRVALSTVGRDVRAGERELCVGVIETGGLPAARRMAFCAGVRE